MKSNALKKSVMLFALLLLAVLFSALFVACSDADGTQTPTEPLMYNLNEDDTYSVAKCDVSQTDVVIPETYKGKRVVKIENGAFDDCKNVLSLVIPDSVTEVEINALNGLRNLQKLTAPAVALSSVSKIQKIDTLIVTSGEAIAENTVSGWDYLKSVTLPDTLKTIGDLGFAHCELLEQISLPEGLTSIGANAFYNCASIEQFNLPDSVESIGNYAFGKCASLETVSLSKSLSTVGNWVFASCNSLINLTISPENANYYSAGNCIIERGTHTLVLGCLGSIIPNDGTIKIIGHHAFARQETLVSITLPDSVTTIETYAFDRCSSLVSVDLGIFFTTFERYSFTNCPSIEYFTYPGTMADFTAYVDQDTVYMETGKNVIYKCSDGNVERNPSLYPWS